MLSTAALAADIQKIEPNDDLASAQNIDASFDRSASPDILHATFLPHATILATGNDTFDYYEFTVADNNTKGIFDVDHAYVAGNYLRTHISILNSSGEELATDSYGHPSYGAKGSVSSYDAYIDYDFETSGTYYLKVAKPTDLVVTNGLSYQLHVTLSPINLTADTDGDGMPDSFEAFFSFNPLVADSSEDIDGDMLTNLEEYQKGSDPTVADTDLDGIPNETDNDDDGDGLTDAEEASMGTNPLLVDSDGDGSADNVDAFPTLIDASIDSDGDGYADAWTNACDLTCQQNSTLVLDLFPSSAAAYKDVDRDGLPDEWLDSCDDQCRVDSGLTLDPDADFADSDGDGLSNAEDDDDNNDGVTDIDADSDGLIEIYTLAQLNAIRYSLNGAGYKESSSAIANTSGCPITLLNGKYQQACIGYELMNDLDLDTSGDGLIDDADEFWNEGNGWTPIGNSSYRFTARLEGHGFTLKNLFIDQDDTSYKGLFGYIADANIRNLKILGDANSVKGFDYSGLLAGYIYQSELENIQIKGQVTGADDYAGLLAGYITQSTLNNVQISGVANVQDDYAGLLSGYLLNSQIQNIKVNGQVNALDDSVGLVAGAISSSEVVNVIAQGQVSGDYNAGGIAGFFAGEIRGAQASVVIRANQYVGGLIGWADDNSQITSAMATGYVSTLGGYAGGLIGHLDYGSHVSYSYAAVALEEGNYIGGLVGRFYSNSNTPVVVTNSYWANDIVENSYIANEETGYVGLSLSVLQCAVQADTTSENSDCVSADGTAEGLSAALTLFKEWGSAGYTNESGVFQPYWSFGSNQQLPSLNIDGNLYRDSDGDGITDVDDAWDYNRAVAIDADSDGYPDSWNLECDDQCIAESGLVLDQFPSSAAGHLDTDLDGLLDAWADTCDDQCKIDSGLTLDSFPNDFDNDGELDSIDTDDNNDGIADIDADSDGLIDISTLAQLNAMRYALDGSGYRSDVDAELNQSGCPTTLVNGTYARRCVGYELLNDLNFDSNADGVFDELDDYWNDGEGWLPIGNNNSQYFNTEFDGNGFAIRNLFINRPNTDYVGLLGYARDSNLRNLSLIHGSNIVSCDYHCGLLLGYGNESIVTNVQVKGQVTSNSTAGLIVGGLYNSELTRLSAEGQLSGDSYLGGIAGRFSGELSGAQSSVVISGGSYAGGLVGYSDDDSRVSNAFSTGYISITYDVAGGLIGHLDYGGQVTNSYAAVVLEGRNNIGGLVGRSYSNSNSPVVVTNSYWANDLVESSYSAKEETGYVGLALSVLQCAVQTDTTSENSDCVSADGTEEGLSAALTLFKEWGNAGYNNESGEFQAYWNFGTNLQLPGLNIGGVVFRDSDGDGIADGNDAWEYNRAVSMDADGDGYPDSWNLGCDIECIENSGLILDQFPSSGAGYADADLDGLLDAWADTCDEQCKIDSGLTLDSFPNDADNDGESDLVDTDDNNDGIVDIDADSDGLVDISTLAQLDAIRFELSGSGYRVSQGAELDQSGCPAVLVNGEYQRRCQGYELLSDLDFDTNSNGAIDELDEFWNNGSGWAPIGTSNDAFATTFDGNGHSIHNLYVNRQSNSYIGLFGFSRNAELRNLTLIGDLTSVEGYRYVAILAGYLTGNSKVSHVTVSGDVNTKYNNDSYVGGLIGYLDEGGVVNAAMANVRARGGNYIGGLLGYVNDNAQILNSYATGSVHSTGSHVGGLTGRLDYQASISNSYAAVYVSGISYVGGLVGTTASGVTITNSYWANDNIEESAGASGDPIYAGLPIQILQCATQADTTFENSDCVSEDGSTEGLSGALTLFKEWGEAGYTNESGVFQPYWTFGTDLQLPTLVLNDSAYRDSDGDGVLDTYDAWQDNYAASQDEDNDGYPDRWTLGCDSDCIANSGLVLDQFPESDAGYIDTDLDGLLDEWAETCNAQCQSDSGLTLDAYPTDFDNDGQPDLIDTDDNNDGVVDIDGDSDGLIDVYTLAQLNAMRYRLDGAGYQAGSNTALDQSGCPPVLLDGVYQRSCQGYELMNDLDMDTNSDGQMNESDAFWNNGAGWVAIGTSSSSQFKTVFEGNGYAIKNLFIDRQSSNYSLFGYMRRAEIRNLTMNGELTQVNCYQNCGLLVGTAWQSTLLNISASGSVQSTYNQAGVLAGSISGNSTVENIQVVGSVLSTRDYLGLLAGNVSDSLVKDVQVQGSVTGDDYLGGVIGNSYRNTLVDLKSEVVIQGDDTLGGITGYLSTNSQLYNAMAASDITGDVYIGGIAGSLSTNSQISNAFSISDLAGASQIGGIVGYLYQSSISATYSTGSIEGTSSMGGLVGYSGNSSEIHSSLSTTKTPGGGGLLASGYANLTNSYWANDVAGTYVSTGLSESNSVVGLGLRTLQCAQQANTTFENSGCVSEDGSSENLNGPITLYREWQSVGTTNESEEVMPYWSFGNENQLPYLTIGGVEYKDSDGDGVLDTADANPFDHDNDGIVDSADGFVLIPITGYTDTDNDGRPDDCETECTDLGMTADTDDDNDGVLDENDFYKLISLDGRTDTDGDGIPNDCDADCILLGMLADLDDDNDGYLDDVDAFDTDPTEWSDFDGDLIGDNADTDDDNDGVLDIDDENLGQDDGSPFFGTTELAERNISVTTDNGQHASVIFDADYFTSLNASDVYDDTVEIEGSLNGSVFTLEESALLMPSGRQVIQWVAIDDAGNRSTALEQIVNVYPRVRFDVDESVSGEGSNAQIVVRLTGDSPEYPVVVNLQMNAASDTDQDDFAPEFDTALVHQVTIEQGEEETLNREAIFSVPVVQDNVSENDELMLIDLLGVPVEEGEENFFAVDDVHKQHSLTVTYENLAPTVQIKFEQDGSEVTNITLANGLVTVTAVVVEGNDTDTHTYQWTLDESLGLTQPTGGTFTFAPSSLPTGTYNFAVKVTDSGLGNLEAEALSAIELVWFNGYVDTDGDGKPNLCSTECVSLGLEEDLDDDNDGVPDIEDYYELIFVDEANDFDRDGRPDTCDSSCVDATGMSEDLDDDNDGVVDLDDPNLGPDDGKPVFDANNAETLHLAVTSANHSSTTLVLDADFYAAFGAEDVVDSEVEYKGTWNNNPLVINNDNELILPAGRQVIQWVAVDDAGNESEVVEQVINVYPRVGFDAATSITGEGSEAKITVKLTGDAPTYPVVVNLQVSELSDITQDDVSDEFVIDQIQQVTIEAGANAEEPNREVVLTIPVNQDNVAENDELLIVDVLGIHVPEGEQTFIAVNEDANQHAVTVTQENIAPEVTLVLKQNDVEVANVVQDAGTVSVTAQVTDTNGDDTHVLEWNLGDLPLNAPTGNVLNFDPINLDAGSYPISLTATDDGLNPLSGMGSLDLVVVSTDVAPTLELTLMQDGQPVVNVQKDGGLVTVQVAIIDDEGETGHTLSWDLSALGINAPDGTRLEFDPANITSGIYEISVTVTDENNQTDTKTLSIAVVSADDGRTTGGSDDGGSSGGGGGAMAWYLLLMLSLLWQKRAAVRR